MKKYYTNKQVLTDKLLNENNLLKQDYKYFKIEGIWHFLVINEYETFSYIKLDNGIGFFMISNKFPIQKFKDLFLVENNPLFKLENIYKGSLKNSNVILEGADGTGKTTIAKELALNEGLICEDRNVLGISKHISNDIDMEARYQIIERFIKSSNKEILLFYLKDIKEMLNRIYKRERVTEYDKNAIESQKKYILIGESLEKKYNNIHLCDVTNKTVEEVKHIVRGYSKGEKY